MSRETADGRFKQDYRQVKPRPESRGVHRMFRSIVRSLAVARSIIRSDGAPGVPARQDGRDARHSTI